MYDLIMKYQNTIINMLMEGRLTQEEFDILANLSEGIENETLDLVIRLRPEDLKDREVIDCILNRHYRTALEIIS